jgi:hypothetical protein
LGMGMTRLHVRARLRLALAGCALLGAGAALAAPAAADAQRVNPAYRGVHIGYLDYNTPNAEIDRRLDVAGAARANIARLGVSWEVLQHDGPGTFSSSYLARLDNAVAGALRRGIRLLPVVYAAPCWASSAPPEARGNCRPAPRPDVVIAYPPSNPHDYATMAATLARRYRGRLAAFEVYNEVDHNAEYYWAGPDKTARYAALMRATYPAMKAADPGLPVLAGSLVGHRGGFLRELYQHGWKGFYDGIAFHTYGRLVLDSIRSIRRVQSSFRDSKPLWMTEFGWASCGTRGRQRLHECTTEVGQARKLSDIFRALRGVSFVAGVIVYDLEDLGSDSDMGIIRRDGSRKAAFFAMRDIFGGRILPPRKPTLRVFRRGNNLRATGTSPTGDVLQLRGFYRRERRPRYTLTLVPSRDEGYFVRLPKRLGSGRWRLQAVHPWTNRKAEVRIVHISRLRRG